MSSILQLSPNGEVCPFLSCDSHLYIYAPVPFAVVVFTVLLYHQFSKFFPAKVNDAFSLRTLLILAFLRRISHDKHLFCAMCPPCVLSPWPSNRTIESILKLCCTSYLFYICLCCSPVYTLHRSFVRNFLTLNGCKNDAKWFL